MHPVISAYLNWKTVYHKQPIPRFTEEWYKWARELDPVWQMFDDLTEGRYRYSDPRYLASPSFRLERLF